MSDVVTIIEARPQSLAERLRAVWTHRSFYPLLMREIALHKFHATVFGFWWLVIRPLIPTLTAVISFTFFVPVDTKGLPYPIFYFSGFITWDLLHSAVLFMPRTMLWMRGMMKKMYFPRLLVPLASVAPPLMEFLVILVMFALTLLVLYLREGVLYLTVGWQMLLVLPCFVLSLTLGVAIGMVSSVIALYVRDIIYSIGYFVQLAMIVTPVLYPMTVVPEHLRWIVYVVNPMAALIETSRWALTGHGDFSPFWLSLATVEILGITSLCLLFFLRAEAYLGDAM